MVRLPLSAWIFSSHTSDFKTGTPVATLPGVRRYRVLAWTGWPGVRILGRFEIESLSASVSVCLFLSVCLSVSQCGSTYKCLSRSFPETHLRVAGTLSKQPTNQQQPGINSRINPLHCWLDLAFLGPYAPQDSRKLRK